MNALYTGKINWVGKAQHKSVAPCHLVMDMIYIGSDKGKHQVYLDEDGIIHWAGMVIWNTWE